MTTEYQTYLYYHRNVLTGQVFYIGIGKNKRAWVGLSTKDTRRSIPWRQYVSLLGAENVSVELVAEHLSLREAMFLEGERIFAGRKAGWPLVNIAAWFSGAVSLSEATRKKLGDHTRGKKQSPEHVAKRAALQVGKTHPPEVRARIKAAVAGKTLSIEHRRKIGEANARRVITKETREKLRRLNQGKKLSAQQVEGMRLRATGKNPSHATREKMRAAQTGRKHSPETLEKLRRPRAKRPKKHLDPVGSFPQSQGHSGQ